MNQPIPTLRWEGDIDGALYLIDQTCLPEQLVERQVSDVDELFVSIQHLRVRGAPAIGVSAAYGVVLGMQDYRAADVPSLLERVDRVVDYLASSRPTAVNLAWALHAMRDVARQTAEANPTATPDDIAQAVLDAALALHEEDRQMCRAIGRHGAPLLADGAGVLTHCNAGGLATSEYGTALALIFAASEAGKKLQVYVDETRPLLQGSRLTAWELVSAGIDATLICDSMAAQVMREGRVQAVVTGADRIAANGDVANKIGTYAVALAARAHDIPFYVAAPSSTFDLSLADGSQIPIEERNAAEITHGFGRPTAPEGVRVYNPAFDVTPAALVTAIVCERGIISPVDTANIRSLLAADR